MKKRHQQKLIILSFGLFVFLNIPFVMIFNVDGAIWGLPILYFYIFLVWLFSIIISFIVLKKHYE